MAATTAVLDSQGQNVANDDDTTDVSQWVAARGNTHLPSVQLQTVGGGVAHAVGLTKRATFANANGRKALRSQPGSAMRLTATAQAVVPEVDLAGRTVFVAYRFASAPTAPTTLLVRHAVAPATAAVRVVQAVSGTVYVDSVAVGSPATGAQLAAGQLQVISLLLRGADATLTWSAGTATTAVATATTTGFVASEQRVVDVMGEYNDDDTSGVATGSSDVYIHELRFYATQMSVREQQLVCDELTAAWS